MPYTFGFVGGDARMRYLASSVAADGYPVCVHGLEKLSPGLPENACALQALVRQSTVIVLPLPVSQDGQFLFAPYAAQPIRLDDDFAQLFQNRIVYGGMLRPLLDSSAIWQTIAPEDYYTREELMTGNAIPTAEGAVMLAMEAYSGTINGAVCLVTGYGRIGKHLAYLLRSMGASVYAAARKPEHRMQMRAFGIQPLDYRNITQRFDLIFNTVPSLVLPSAVLRRQGQETLLIELASRPGGIDRQAAAEMGLRVLDAAGLPGKTAPKTAAEYMKEAIYNMLEE